MHLSDVGRAPLGEKQLLVVVYTAFPLLFAIMLLAAIKRLRFLSHGTL